MKKFLVTFEVESGDEYTSPQLLAEVHSGLRYWFQSTSVKYTGLDVVQQDEADDEPVVDNLVDNGPLVDDDGLSKEDREWLREERRADHELWVEHFRDDNEEYINQRREGK